MSDDDQDIDIESDEDTSPVNNGKQEFSQNVSQNEKRAHHNALERKRRDHIKDTFKSLQESVSSMKGEKASRAQILQKTVECIQIQTDKIQSHKKEVREMKKQKVLLDAQIRLLEKTRDKCMMESRDLQLNPVVESENSDSEVFGHKIKKIKTTFEV